MSTFETAWEVDSGGCRHLEVTGSGDDFDPWFGRCVDCGWPVVLMAELGLMAFYRPVPPGPRTWRKVWDPECATCGDKSLMVEKLRGRYVLLCSKGEDSCEASGWSDTIHGLQDVHAEMIRVAT